MITIEESQPNLPDPPASKGATSPADESHERRLSAYGVAGHVKSSSSLRTANTETMERVAETMAVIQRDGTSDSYSAAAIADDDFGCDEPSVNAGPTAEIKCTASVEQYGISQFSREEELVTSSTSSSANDDSAGESCPVRAFAHVQVPLVSEQKMSHDRPSPPSPKHAIGSAVAARVQAYERRMSREAEVPSPTNTKQREERTVTRPVVRYGLAPRPSLFVANPDRQDGG